MVVDSLELNHDVAVWVEDRAGAGWHDTRRVVLLDDARTGPRGREVGATDDRRIQPAALGTEVDAPKRAGSADTRGFASAVHHDALGNARSIRYALPDDSESHELDGF